MRKTARTLACALALTVLGACSTSPAVPVPTATPPTVETPVLPVESHAPLMTRDSFPRLDGSTSTAPLARAVCAVLLGEDVDQASDLVRFSKTTASFRSLMYGDADLLIAAEPSESVVAEMEEAGFQWQSAPIATDALVFLVNESNPVDSLTTQQVQKIYTGEIVNWSQVGGEDRAIVPFQRNAEAGSQTLMKKLVMGDLPLMEAPKDYTVASMEGLIEAVRSFDGSPGAIGYTVYYYANDMNMADGLKVVTIDGAAPDAGSIRSGAYPFTNPYYTVLAADAPADGPARQVFDWLQGPIGQSLIQHEGYVSILDDPAPVDWDLGETAPLEEVYTRLSPEPLTQLVPSGGYGPLLSFVGASLPGGWWDYDRYGLVTRQGEIVVDPVYDSVWPIGGYIDGNSDDWVDLGVFSLGQTLPVGPDGGHERRYALAARDGSWTTGFDYLYVGMADAGHIWAVEPDGTGVMLDARAQELWRLPLPVGDEEALWTYQGGMAGSLWWSEGLGICYRQAGQSLIRMNGTMVHGGEKGWRDLQGFSEGLAPAVDNSKSPEQGDLWGYVDRDGEWAISPIYRRVQDFHDGKAIAQLPDGSMRVIDTAGNMLWESNEGRMALYRGDGFSYYCHLEDVDERYLVRVLGLYDLDLEPIQSEAVGKTLNGGTSGWMWEESETGTRLYSSQGVRDIPARGSLNYILDGLLIFCQDQPDGSALWSAYDMEGGALLAPVVCDYMGSITDSGTGIRYLYVQQGGRCDIYDQTGRYLTSTTGYPDVKDGLITTRTDLSYGYQTLDGDWIFRISLAKSQGD